MSFPNLYENLGFTWAGRWVPGREYVTHQIVQDDQGVYYAALCDNSGVPLSDTRAWVLLFQHPRVAANMTGSPVLRGPYVVDHTDFTNEGDAKTLWTPRVGDVVLKITWDWQSLVPWDHGVIMIGQDPHDTDTELNSFWQFGNFKNGQGPTLDFDWEGFIVDPDGNQRVASAYVCHTTAPIKVMLVPDTDNRVDATAGHVDLYALVAQAVAP